MVHSHGPPSHIQCQIGILLHWWCITGKTMGSLKPTIGFKVWLRLLASAQGLQGSSSGWEVCFLLLTNSGVGRALAHLTFLPVISQHFLIGPTLPLWISHYPDWSICPFSSWIFSLVSSFLSAILPTALHYICFETHFPAKVTMSCTMFVSVIWEYIFLKVNDILPALFPLSDDNIICSKCPVHSPWKSTSTSIYLTIMNT